MMLLNFCLIVFGIVHLEENSVEMQFDILKKKLEVVGMDTGICVPGQYNHLLCPKVFLFQFLSCFYFLLYFAKLNAF